MSSRPILPEHDAIIDAMQDQIDDLTALVAVQEKQLTRQRRLIARMAPGSGVPSRRQARER